ncbi:ubiquinol-cytochrome c reductase ubiquinone-binding protein [Megachile rotundata]|uniref:ubiquinol-cytochrome c reductase ubiquinone-binding protein n=1 Tax=Megachile rotundata TaxID=143995 RepID=UPI000258E282|nr:PREDICTED: cytochrome b-c1 complex subunit 8-like [Megachile rotundata]XP_012138427.1 PREDICTED: cytochrome b-c1 complex subunit 8-like [Megachile rotundata]
MGLQFGNLAKISRITFFRLSPYEQNPFAGMISDGLPNFVRRAQEILLKAGPMFLGSYMLMEWADAENHKMHRKEH